LYISLYLYKISLYLKDIGKTKNFILPHRSIEAGRLGRVAGRSSNYDSHFGPYFAQERSQPIKRWQLPSEIPADHFRMLKLFKII